MDKTRLAYLVSIATIIVLLLFIGNSLSHRLANPKPDEPATVVQYGKLMVTDNKSIVSYSITNYEEHPVNYIIKKVFGDGEDAYYSNTTQQLDASESMSQSMHISERMRSSNLTIDIYKENETTPFDSNTYILR